MKRKLTPFCVLSIALMAMISTVSLHAQENLILNGDFEVNKELDPEADFYWWRNNSDISMGDWQNVDNQINNGTCRMPGPAQARSIRQDIEIASPGSYTLKFTGRIQNANGPNGSSPNDRDGNGPATLTATVTGFDVDGTTLLVDPLITLTTQSNTNETVSSEFEIPGDITKVRVLFTKNWNIAFLDDVMLYSGTSAVDQVSIQGLRVSTDNKTIRIDATADLSVLSLYDISGRIIKTLDCKGQSHVEVNDCTQGVYIIYITDVHGNMGMVKQIIK